MDIYLPKHVMASPKNPLPLSNTCFKIKRIRFHWLIRIQRSVQHKTLKLQSLTCKGQRTFVNSGIKTHQNVKWRMKSWLVNCKPADTGLLYIYIILLWKGSMYVWPFPTNNKDGFWSLLFYYTYTIDFHDLPRSILPKCSPKLPHNLSNMLDIPKASHVPVHLPKVKRDSNSTPVHMKMLEKVNAKTWQPRRGGQKPKNLTEFNWPNLGG